MAIPLTQPIDRKLLSQIESYLPLLRVKLKVQEVARTMASQVTIDDSHNYTRNSDGKWLPGVTSVSDLFPKPWLSAWGAKEAVKFLGYSDFKDDTENATAMLAKIKALETVDEYQALLKEAKGASARKSKDALVDGKAGHAWIEEYIKAKIAGTKLPEIPKDDLLTRPLTQFVEWEEKNVAMWLLSEAIVCDTEREYAGTLDAVAILTDGSLAIVDAKFASHISPEYALQTAGYAATFEQHGVFFDKRLIVRLPKTLEKPEWNEKERKYEMVKNTIEVHEIETSYEFDRDTFYSALPVKKWVNYVKKMKG